MEEVLEILGSPRRRAILWLTWEEERAAGEIHAALDDVTFGAVSQHLRLLQRAGLVTCRRDGRRRLYRAHKDNLGPLRSWLETLWDDKLLRLRLRAEMEASRRGPAPQTRRPSR